jgi:hypothetical protein
MNLHPGNPTIIHATIPGVVAVKQDPSHLSEQPTASLWIPKIQQ